LEIDVRYADFYFFRVISNRVIGIDGLSVDHSLVSALSVHAPTAGHSVRTIIVACVEIVLLNYSILPSPSRLYGKTTNNNATRRIVR
jgi:hypothetical protein